MPTGSAWRWAIGLWRGAAGTAPCPATPVLAALLLLAGFLALPRVAQHVINPGERLLMPGLLVLLLAVPLPAHGAAAARGAGRASPWRRTCWSSPCRTTRWARPVHFRDMAATGGARALFRHRPTSFACKWEELRHSEVTGEAPRLPISFRTSLLETTAAPFDCPVPDGP